MLVMKVVKIFAGVEERKKKKIIFFSRTQIIFLFLSLIINRLQIN